MDEEGRDDEDIVEPECTGVPAAATSDVPDDVTAVNRCDDPHVSNERDRRRSDNTDEVEDAAESTVRLLRGRLFLLDAVEELSQTGDSFSHNDDEELERFQLFRDEQFRSLRADILHVIEHCAAEERDRERSL